MSTDKFQNKYRIPSTRATWHDYNGGDYFITICTKNMDYYFGTITCEGEIIYTEIGNFAVKCIQNIPNHFPNTEIPLFVVMPNHIHLIIAINNGNRNNNGEQGNGNGQDNGNGQGNCNGNEQGNCRDAIYDVSTTKTTITTPPPTPPDETPQNLSMVKNEKMQFIANKCGLLSHIISNLKSSVTRYAKQNNILFGWQTRFYDRIIRDRDELYRIANYIESNPIKWTEDKFYTE